MVTQLELDRIATREKQALINRRIRCAVCGLSRPPVDDLTLCAECRADLDASERHVRGVVWAHADRVIAAEEAYQVAYALESYDDQQRFDRYVAALQSGQDVAGKAERTAAAYPGFGRILAAETARRAVQTEEGAQLDRVKAWAKQALSEIAAAMSREEAAKESML